MSRKIVYLFAIAIVCPSASSRADPPAPPRDNLPAGRWNLEFANGVKEVCEIRKDGSTSVVEPLRSSTGTAEVKDSAIVLTFQDDRVERWTPVGARMVVEHWAASARFPTGTPVFGIGEAANLKGLQMSIRMEKERYRADEPIKLEVVLMNPSVEKANLGKSAADWNLFDLEVRYVGGGMMKAGRMPLTKYGTRRFRQVDQAMNFSLSMSSGGQLSYRFELNRMVDMTLSGTYSIVIKRTIPAQPVQGEVRGAEELKLISNVLSVEITEPPAPNR